MAVVRRDEPASRQLSIDGSYNVSLTHCITLGTYSLRREDGFPPQPNREAKDWSAIYPYQEKASEASLIDVQANSLSEYYSD